MANKKVQSWEEFEKETKSSPTWFTKESLRQSSTGMAGMGLEAIGKQPSRKTVKLGKTNLKLQQVQFPVKIISREQQILGELFGQGDKFFGSGEMLPFSGTPQNEGRDTWRIFGI